MLLRFRIFLIQNKTPTPSENLGESLGKPRGISRHSRKNRDTLGNLGHSREPRGNPRTSNPNARTIPNHPETRTESRDPFGHFRTPSDIVGWSRNPNRSQRLRVRVYCQSAKYPNLKINHKRENVNT